MTKSSQEISLAAWSLLLSQRQEFLNNHPARVPVNPNQQGTHEIRDEVLSSVCAQDMDTSGNQVSDLDDVDIYWDNDQLDADAFFVPGIDTLFSPTAFDDFGMGSSAGNPILLDKEEDRKTLLQQHQSLRDQHGSLHCWEVVYLEQEKKKFLIIFIGKCFNRYYRVCDLI